MTDPAPIPCPFQIIIDSREQAPWSFRGLSANADKDNAPLAVDCKAGTLSTGDYSIAGFENYLTIERKSLPDAWSTFTHDRERWERELDRMTKIASCHVVIEGGWDELSAGPVKPGGAVIGKSVMRSIFAWTIRYPHIHWWPMPSRELAEVTAFRLMEKFWEQDQWQVKQLNKLGASQESNSRRKSKPSAGQLSLPGQ